MKRCSKFTLLGLVMALVGSAAINAAELAVPCHEQDAQQSTANDSNDSNDHNPWRYPHEAKRQRAEGTVRLQVQLDKSGTATQVKLADSSASSLLDRAALKAARGERFCRLAEPAQPMTGQAEVAVNYSLSIGVARL